MITRRSLVLVAELKGWRFARFLPRFLLERITVATLEPVTVDARRLLALASTWEAEARVLLGARRHATAQGYGAALRDCAKGLRQVVDGETDSEDRQTPTPTAPLGGDS